MTASQDPASGFDADSDKFHDECGVFGIFGHPEAAPHTALGLHALQHRGQEACGIVAFDGKHFHAHRALGEVGDNFSSEEVIQRLRGHAAIGHNRYATTGRTALRNASTSICALQEQPVGMTSVYLGKRPWIRLLHNSARLLARRT